MDLDALTPAQRRVVDELMDWPNRSVRPRFEPDLPLQLRDALEDALGPLADQLNPGELYVSKKKLGQVLACEAHHVAAEEAGFGGWSPRAARGTVAHKAIELSMHMPAAATPLALVDAAVERLVADADDDEWGPGRYLAAADAVERAELRAEVNDIVVKFEECFPRLDAEWRPRTESVARVDLCDGRIVLSGKVDLALGRATGTEARVLVVDLKTGAPWPSHLDDLRFYALVHTMRTGVPPFRVASYYLDSCSFRAEHVTVELLLTTAVGRVVEGVRRMVELHLKQREPTLTPGPACGWCPRREACDGPALWAAERAARGLDPFD